MYSLILYWARRWQVMGEKTYSFRGIWETGSNIPEILYIFSQLIWVQFENKIIGSNIWLKAQEHTKAVNFEVVLLGLVRAESRAPLPMGYFLFRAKLRKVLVSMALMSTMSFPRDKSPRRRGAEESESNVREHVAWEWCCHTGEMHVMDPYIFVRLFLPSPYLALSTAFRPGFRPQLSFSN